MRMMKHPVFRRFWYPTLALADLASGPKPFTLLGENLVLWLDGDGEPAALEDRCPHRRARLSVASRVIDGDLQCGYHGWRFNGSGRCTLVPQMPELVTGTKHNVRRFQCQARYGFVWVCLEDDALGTIPDLRHSDEPGYRQVMEYAEDWKANALVVCENALDLAHVSFVHRGTFGNEEKPATPRLNFVPLEGGVNFRCLLPVANRELQQKNLRIADNETVRTVDIRWIMPCAFVLHFTYPTGLVQEICGFATPIDDGRVRRIQFAYRNDTEADAPAEQVAAFDRSVAAEDREILESCDANFILSPVLLAHMTLDRPGLLMRRMLSDLIVTHDPNAAAIANEIVTDAAELESVA